jgi:hypothetical protein
VTDVQRLLDALTAAGVHFVVVGGVALDALERAKRAAGRARDLLDLAEIAEIRRRVGRPL